MLIVRAPYALRRFASITYGLGEGRVRRVPFSSSEPLRSLLESGVALGAAGELSEVAAAPPMPLEELLITTGFQRIASRLSQGVYRVVIERGAHGRLARLTRREFDVARLAVLGWSSRRIGTELGVASPTVRGALERAVSKLDLVASIQLPLLWHTLAAAPRRVRAPSGMDCLLFECSLPPRHEALTLAEAALLERLMLGDSYRSIAAHRHVSVRTVANQLSRLYERLGVSNRIELVAHVLRGGASHAPDGLDAPDKNDASAANAADAAHAAKHDAEGGPPTSC